MLVDRSLFLIDVRSWMEMGAMGAMGALVGADLVVADADDTMVAVPAVLLVEHVVCCCCVATNRGVFRERVYIMRESRGESPVCVDLFVPFECPT